MSPEKTNDQRLMEMGARVADWLEPLGYSSSESSSGGCVVANLGGETRFYVREGADDYVVTSATRSGSEEFEVACRTIEDSEKFLVAQFGGALRYQVRRDAPPFDVPWRPSEFAVGFTLRANEKGQGVLEENGLYWATFPIFESSPGAVGFSHYAHVSVDHLMNMFMTS
ncbi:immunity protein 61 of polymorphic toxin system [Glaciihabitans tibetensis]|uniref:Immunity protein 61 of polymorphic toxin system n=1 Tax=Glaciihabitans tibetensis TaxID=1266600 RepID=A0A2T0VF60_9MICO|nr:Imm61 family immunity protein [Glaciihabitans tibetensis]PRY68840.1 immunity protein 61 of polymorphic toxin system [Glaciihabitans tibetensis]